MLGMISWKLFGKRENVCGKGEGEGEKDVGMCTPALAGPGDEAIVIPEMIP